jgi:hypothetical protein
MIGMRSRLAAIAIVAPATRGSPVPRSRALWPTVRRRDVGAIRQVLATGKNGRIELPSTICARSQWS